MDKQEFISTLRRELSGMEDYEYINDTINYYENYIESEIRKGNSEEMVLESLGDARLIAKSIRASKDEETDNDEEEEVRTSREFTSEESGGLKILNKFMSLPGWGRRAIGVAGTLVVLVVVGKLLAWMFPVLVVGGIGYMFYRFFKDNFMN